MNYNKDFIELLAKLGPMTNTFGMYKENEIVKVAYKSDTGGFVLTAPDEYFDYTGTFIGFTDFKRFKDYFNIFDRPNKDEKLNETPIINDVVNPDGEVCALDIKSSRGKQHSTYVTALEARLRYEKLNGAALPSVDTSFSWIQVQIEHFKKMISLFKPEVINFKFDNTTCTVLLTNLITHDTYEIEYTLTKPIETPVEFDVLTEGINNIPVGDYEIDVSSKGFLKFHQVREDKINLDIFISKKRTKR